MKFLQFAAVNLLSLQPLLTVNITVRSGRCCVVLLVCCRGVTEARIAYLSVLSLICLGILSRGHHESSSSVHDSSAAHSDSSTHQSSTGPAAAGHHSSTHQSITGPAAAAAAGHRATDETNYQQLHTQSSQSAKLFNLRDPRYEKVPDHLPKV